MPVVFKDLVIGHHKTPLAGPVNAEFFSGDCVAVIGRNGVGKSTLLHTLCGFIPAISGQIAIDGVALQNMRSRELATKLSVVFAGRREVVPEISVHEILKLGRSPYTGYTSTFSKKDKEVLDRVISDLNLGSLLDKRIGSVSDGEAQKVFIGRALVQDTGIIVFDEPTTHLDIFNKREIFSIIRNLSTANKLVFLSTHEIEDVLKISTRVLLFDEGHRIVSGSSTDIETRLRVMGYFQLTGG